VHNKEQLPGALTPEQFRQNPQQQNPATKFAKEERNYDYTRGAVTLRTPIGPDQAIEWATQLNYQDLDHPLSFAVIDQTTYSYSTELRYSTRRRYSIGATVHRRLPVLRHQPDRRPVPERQRQPRFHDQESGERHVHLRDVRREPA
jgi:hypothetical protein